MGIAVPFHFMAHQQKDQGPDSLQPMQEVLKRINKQLVHKKDFVYTEEYKTLRTVFELMLTNALKPWDKERRKGLSK